MSDEFLKALTPPSALEPRPVILPKLRVLKLWKIPEPVNPINVVNLVRGRVAAAAESTEESPNTYVPLHTLHVRRPQTDLSPHRALPGTVGPPIDVATLQDAVKRMQDLTEVLDELGWNDSTWRKGKWASRLLEDFALTDEWFKGGHTTEALTLLSTLDLSRYPVRKYLVSSGDGMSCEKALAFEAKTAPEQGSSPPRYAIVTLPRARKVHQSLLTTPPTFLYSLLVALWHITLAPALQGRPFSDVLLLNGPGT
ncbi:UDP-N-acetylglucosamine transferase subunit, partial [Tulasnella sp. 417]